MGCTGLFSYFGNGCMNPWLPQAGLFGQGGNPYLPMAGYLTSTLGYEPANIWPARNWTQAAQSWTHCAAYPFGFNFNFTGRRTQYVVEPNMSWNTAMGLQTGQIYGGISAPQMGAYFTQRAERFSINTTASLAATRLQQAKTIGDCKDADYMKADENKELREEVLACEKQAEELLKQLEELMKKADSLSPAEYEAKVNVYSEKAKTLVGKTDELYKRIKEAEEAYAAAKKEKATEEAEEAVDDAGTDDATDNGSADVTVAEGDKDLSNDECKKEYGIKKDATIGECLDASSLATQALNAVGKWDDDENKKAFDELFGTGAATDTNKINKGNIVEVLEAVDLKGLIKGVEEQDSGDNRTSLERIVTLLTQRLADLKEAGHISTEDYNNVKAKLKEISDSNKSSFPGVAVTVQRLQDVCNTLKGKGTKDEVEKLIKEAQDKRVTEAKDKFRADYAKKENKTVEAGKTYKFPEEVKYLPNKKLFQVTIESKNFQGKDLAELNSKILKSNDENIIASWKEIKKECLEVQA